MRSELSTVCALGLAAAALGGFAGAARAAEPVPGRPPAADLGAEIWRLRPTHATVPAQSARSPGTPQVGEIPEARRTVRVVYPALTDSR